MTEQIPTTDEQDWWRTAVVYQIYPRSFADSDGDGVGDLPAMTAHLDHLAWLGVDAVWVSPWYPSPMVDGGYDVTDHRDIHPDFGTLDDAREFIDRAHDLGLHVIIDLVPNHCAADHPWFRQALASPEGSRERERFVFRDGRGPCGEEPPNNWPSVFGGPAWTRTTSPDGAPGQWYLHFFDPGQPDWNWDDEEVREHFDAVLRFWFDRGVDGFRVDVADSLVKAEGLPDVAVDPRTGRGTLDKTGDNPMWDRPGLADIQRRWRRIAAEYADTAQGERMFVAEAYLPHDQLVTHLAGDRLQTSFDFEFLQSAWDADSLRKVIDDSLTSHARVGAPATWVLGNHDVVRPVTRYGRPVTGINFATGEPFDDLAVKWSPCDVDLGRRRARAALLLEMALPGGAYVYQGDELGLPEVTDLPAHVRADPSWVRSDHADPGRDGCRVPIPWEGEEPPFGWSSTADTWLPMPARWAELTVAAQRQDPDSTLNLYRRVIAERRRRPALGGGDLVWAEASPGVLDFTRGGAVRCVVNLAAEPLQVDPDRVVVASRRLVDGRVEADTAVWLEV